MYEDFLDSQITATDLYYLEDEELARQLVEFGYRGSGTVCTRAEFLQKKKEAELNKSSSGKKVVDISYVDPDTDEHGPVFYENFAQY